MKKKKIWNICTSILVAIIVLLAVLLVGVRLFGIQIYTVLSSSMEPSYHTGAVIYVHKTDSSKLEVGDVITFKVTENSVATHRIVEIVGEGNNLSFRTKGDANDTEDGRLISSDNVVGEVVFTIPYLGYLVQLIQTKAGRYAVIAIGAILILTLILPDLLFNDDL